METMIFFISLFDWLLLFIIFIYCEMPLFLNKILAVNLDYHIRVWESFSQTIFQQSGVFSIGRLESVLADESLLI